MIPQYFINDIWHNGHFWTQSESVSDFLAVANHRHHTAPAVIQCSVPFSAISRGPTLLEYRQFWTRPICKLMSGKG